MLTVMSFTWTPFHLRRNIYQEKAKMIVEFVACYEFFDGFDIAVNLDVYLQSV